VTAMIPNKIKPVTNTITVIGLRNADVIRFIRLNLKL
jgi:hypothetical protein